METESVPSNWKENISETQKEKLKKINKNKTKD